MTTTQAVTAEDWTRRARPVRWNILTPQQVQRMWETADSWDSEATRGFEAAEEWISAGGPLPITEGTGNQARTDDNAVMEMAIAIRASRGEFLDYPPGGRRLYAAGVAAFLGYVLSQTDHPTLPPISTLPSLGA